VDNETGQRPVLSRNTPIACMSSQARREMDEREQATLKTAKQERTINPDTRLHSDEMREMNEKRRLAKGRKKCRRGHVWGTSPSRSAV